MRLYKRLERIERLAFARQRERCLTALSDAALDAHIEELEAQLEGRAVPGRKPVRERTAEEWRDEISRLRAELAAEGYHA